MKYALTAMFAGLLASPATLAAPADDSSGHPLLDLAHELQITRKLDMRVTPGAPGLLQAEHALEQAHAPADNECAGSLGASRFAELHMDVGGALVGQGDFIGAAAAYRRAQACRPRDAQIIAAVAGVLFDARDYAGARESINAALAIAPRAVNANRLAGNIDFVAERWADAVSRFRYVAASDPDRVQAAYGQLMLWLAQMRAGVVKPEYVERTPGDGWPQPLVLYMRGEYTEAELVIPIKEGDEDSNTQENTSTDERLCEALFYVGETYWARGKPEVARDYFASLVNIKVIYFLEHGLALAEIAKLRER
ncbi:MAG TPA: tetratricopeptide repeat protein [Steroidobacteraceae bacterium]|nr:tetratricopeptide repeat protein [Steroidobacteraceae bacterium]